jgi:chemotaxis family two-component system response regulator Rcp1
MLASAYQQNMTHYPLSEPNPEQTIWLVEDNPQDALLIKKSLQRTDATYRLTHLTRGDELLNRLMNSSTPDLIMLDLGLPGLNGFDTLEEISKMSARIRSIPIVILTGYKDFDYIDRNFPLCIQGYWNKPCCSKQLKGLLLSTMATSRYEIDIE